MALQESLNKFKQQQEKCQSTLTSIASRAAPSRTHHSQKTTTKSTPVPAKPPTPVKFSSDTARLQHINNIKNSPVGAQIKLVIDLLYETRQALVPEEIYDACYVDTQENKLLLKSLKDNHKVYYDGKRFSYKSKHDLKGKDNLLTLIRKHAEGLPVVDVKDAYPSVLDD